MNMDLLWLSISCFIAAAVLGIVFDAWTRRSAENDKERLRILKMKQDDSRIVEELRILSDERKHQFAIAADERKHQFTVQKEAEAALKAMTENIDAQLAEVKKQLSHINMRDARGGLGAR